MDGARFPPTHRDDTAMNGVQRSTAMGHGNWKDSWLLGLRIETWGTREMEGRVVLVLFPPIRQKRRMDGAPRLHFIGKSATGSGRRRGSRCANGS